MQFIKRAIEPQEIEVAGVKYPAIWSFRAIATMEEYTGYPHSVTLGRFAQGVRSATDLIGMLLGMLTAAGVEVTADELADNLDPDPEAEQALAMQMIAIVIGQSLNDGDESKNAKAPTKTHKQTGSV